MTNGSQVICAAAVIASDGNSCALRDNSVMRDDSSGRRDPRLRKHADYQRVYKESRKHFSASMSYFFRRRSEEAQEPARVGLTAGKVLGKAVARNRIKRRMREAVRMNLPLLPAAVDVVLHPRKSVIDMDFGKLTTEVRKVFSTVSAQVEGRPAGNPAARNTGTRR